MTNVLKAFINHLPSPIRLTHQQPWKPDLIINIQHLKDKGSIYICKYLSQSVTTLANSCNVDISKAHLDKFSGQALDDISKTRSAGQNSKQIVDILKTQLTTKDKRALNDISKTNLTAKIRKEAIDSITSQIDNYIPITIRDIYKSIINHEGFLSPEEQSLLNSFISGVRQAVSLKIYTSYEQMKEWYEYLNPDKDTYATKELSYKERLERESKLLLELSSILEMSNFRHLPKASLDLLLLPHDTKGVQVSINHVDITTLGIWVQGWTHEVLSDRAFVSRLKYKLLSWWTEKLPKEMNEITASRVFMAIRTRNERKLLLKIFKNINLMNLEQLFPNAKVKMKLLDKKIMFGTISLGAISLLTKYLILSNMPISASWTFSLILAVVASRVWFSYSNKRNAYIVDLMQTLYYHNLANNSGALSYLHDKCIDERIKELLLAYCFLLSVPNRRGVRGTIHTTLPPQHYTSEGVKKEIENWIEKEFNIKINFDINDSLNHLSSLGLLKRTTNGQLIVLEMKEAMNILPKPMYQWSDADDVRVL